MAGKLAVVVGITGKQGGSAAKSLLEAGYKIRGITRDPSKPSAKAWADKGVEVVAGDMNVEASMMSAFKGAAVIFTNADFWIAAYDSKIHALAAAEGRQPNELAYDIELQQHKYMIHAAAATLSTLERLVFSTLSSAKNLSKGKYTQVFHFDGKAAAADYLRNQYPELAKKTSFIHLPLYLDAFLEPPFSPRKEGDGKYVSSAPASGETMIPVGDPKMITGPFVLALIKEPAGKNLQACSGMMSFNQWADRVSKKLGITLRFEEMPMQTAIDLIPVFGRELAEMGHYFNDFGYHGSDPTTIFPEQLGVDVKYQTIDEYFDSADFSQILA